MTKNIILERIKEGNKYFSIISLISSFALYLLIFFQKQFHLIMTFNFIKAILLSEILNSIGNIIQAFDHDKIVIFSFISITDIFTYTSFLFFSYSSKKLIKETDNSVKNKTKLFLIISLLISVIYYTILLVITLAIDKDDKYVDIRFKDYYCKNDKNIDKFSNKFYFFSVIHTTIIMVISYFIITNFWEVLNFWKEKAEKDKIKYQSIINLIKIIFRYVLICILYWFFLIPRILFVSESGKDNNTLRDIFYLFSESFFCLRGFLISINTFTSSRIQMIISRFIEVDIKHYLLINFGQYSSRKISKATIKIEEPKELV